MVSRCVPKVLDLRDDWLRTLRFCHYWHFVDWQSRSLSGQRAGAGEAEKKGLSFTVWRVHLSVGRKHPVLTFSRMTTLF